MKYSGQRLVQRLHKTQNFWVYSVFLGFNGRLLAEILSRFKKYDNLRKVAVREKVWLIINVLWTLGWLDGLVEIKHYRRTGWIKSNLHLENWKVGRQTFVDKKTIIPKVEIHSPYKTSWKLLTQNSRSWFELWIIESWFDV